MKYNFCYDNFTYEYRLRRILKKLVIVANHNTIDWACHYTKYFNGFNMIVINNCAIFFVKVLLQFFT